MVMATLTADDWVTAAYDRFNTGGLAAVKVEPVARSLGATKGSFYWHFANRGALVDAVMARWEQVETDQIIAIADAGESPTERLEQLFAVVAARRSQPSGETTLYVDAAAEGVQPIVARVTERRIAYIAEILVELGFSRDEAVRRGTVATAVVLGMQQLAAGAGDEYLDAIAVGLTQTALAMTLAR